MKTVNEIDTIIKYSVKVSKNRIELWINILSNLKVKNICEIGVFKGFFAEKLLNSLDHIESYILIDPWRNLSDWNKPSNSSDEEFDSIRLEALQRLTKHKDKIKEFRDITKEAAKGINLNSLDFAYIDGDHTLRGITIDLDAIFDKVKNGGFIGGDDCTKNIWQHGTTFDPTMVFPYVIYFAEAKNLRIYLLPYGQFFIYKGSEAYEVIDHDSYMKKPLNQIFKYKNFKENNNIEKMLFGYKFFRKFLRKLKGILKARKLI